MRKIILALTMFSVLAASSYAVSITVENFSFELPGDYKIIGWDDGYYEETNDPAPDIPGWSSDSTVSSSGVESAWPGSTDGLWAGFIFGGDPSVYNLTDFVIPTSIAFSLKVDAQDNGSEYPPGLLNIGLFYDDEGTRVTLGSKTVETVQYNNDGSSWVEYELIVAVDSDLIGHRIGIELDNISNGYSWIGLDNVRLDTVFAYNPSPANGAELIPVDTDLFWTLAEGFTCNVYFGTDPNVDDNPMVITDQDVEFYDAPVCDFDTTYYWRVDPIDPNDGSPYVLTGSTWTFTTVAAVPIITAQPQDVIIDEGATAVFTVQAYDPQGGTLAYQWYKFVDGTNDQKLSGQKTATLTIPLVSVANEGQYYCVITNVDPEPTVSELARLLVKDIIGWWSFDTTAPEPNDYDLSGNGNNVTVHGAVAGNDGTALDFDGINDYVSVPVEVFNRLGDSQVTICLWQYATGSQWTTVFQGVDDSDPDPAYASRILNAHVPWGTSVYWDAGDDTEYDRIFKEAKETEYSGQWNHWTFTKNTGTGQMKMYLNGGLWQSGTDLTTPIGEIAVFNIAANAVPIEFYSGMLKDFRIYNYELTPEEIAQLYFDSTGMAPCMTPMPGDFDGDCVVTVDDIVLIATEWLDCGLYPPSECP